MDPGEAPFERPILPSTRPAEGDGHPCGPFEPGPPSPPPVRTALPFQLEGREKNPVFDLRINYTVYDSLYPTVNVLYYLTRTKTCAFGGDIFYTNFFLH